MDREIAIIVAVDEKNGIGRNGGLLCHLPNDLKHFKEVTTGHTIVMGRRTYESLPKGALPNRRNVVITSDKADNYPGCEVVRSVEEAISLSGNDKMFIIGGGQLYKATLEMADTLYITQIHHTFENADTFFPKIDKGVWKQVWKDDHRADEKHKYDYSFIKYMRQSDKMK